MPQDIALFISENWSQLCS